jgi:signal transduction histidine kinase
VTIVDEQLGRWNRAWALAPYPLLAVAAAASLLGAHPWTYRLVTLTVAAAFAGWHWWFVLAHPEWPERRSWLNVGYFTGVLALSTVLMLRSDAFQLLVPACYVLAFVALPGRLAYAGVVAANLPGLVVTGFDVDGALISVGVATPLAALFGAMIRTMEREAVRRRRLNDELLAVNAENARLARDTGIADERARLAREIHDTVAQGLTGIITQLEAVAEVPPEIRGRWDTARALARTSLDEVRRSIEALRPGPLEGARLSEAISHTVTTWSSMYGIPARYTMTGTPVPVHSEVEVTLLRAVQETLSNIRRHARASRAHVTLSYMEDVVVLDVHDDGVGFTAVAPAPSPPTGATVIGSVDPPATAAVSGSGDPPATATVSELGRPPATAAGTEPGRPLATAAVAGSGDQPGTAAVGESGGPQVTGGFGLTALRQRVGALAGSVEVESSPGGGTAISVTVPLIGAGS